MRYKRKKIYLACFDGFQCKGNRLIPFKHYSSVRKFKKDNQFNYDGFNVWDEIMAQKEMNKTMAECHFSYSELYARACWETI